MPKLLLRLLGWLHPPFSCMADGHERTHWVQDGARRCDECGRFIRNGRWKGERPKA